MSENNKQTGFIKYDKDDTKYGGAKPVVEEELKDLSKRRGSDPENLKGLALSGGGIRAASFSLGVMQALAKKNKLEKFDYMSTVSGGGYIGGSLSWLWLDKWQKNQTKDRKFATKNANFPYGTDGRFSNSDENLDRDQASLMRHLRQHGKYLIPGNGITLLSFLSVVIRSVSMGFISLIILASLFFHLLHITPAFNQGYFFSTYAADFVLLSMIVYFICLLLYGIFSIVNNKNADNAYLWRRRWEKGIKYVLLFASIMLLVVIIFMLRVYIGKIDLQSAGGITSVIGAFFAWYGKISNKKNIIKIIPTSLVIKTGVIIMLTGMLLLSEQLAFSINSLDESSLNIQLMLLGSHTIVAILVLIYAYLVPINKVSIHRYYRDRLMETFMPDVENVLKGGDTSIATQANKMGIHECLPDDDNNMPYHIINSNIILVESKISKFRGRGGDNFILTPLYSGSNATGWLKSKAFANGSVTLPTAVAISGAAANSDSGVAGKGLTINPLVSVLMSIFNLRLGYWVVNPNIEFQPNQKTNPSYLTPGFRGIINRKKLNEEANFVQLSDGGHFENLAMYELIRRHCRLIVCCDAEQDNKFVFGGLINIIEKARIDFGVRIKISAEELDKLKYSKAKDGKLVLAKQGYLVADIIYPNNEPVGKLVYVKTTLPENCLSVDLLAYKNNHKHFPDETTIDQFFDEKQLEAYRMLGMNIGELLVNDENITW